MICDCVISVPIYVQDTSGVQSTDQEREVSIPDLMVGMSYNIQIVIEHAVSCAKCYAPDIWMTFFRMASKRGRGKSMTMRRALKNAARKIDDPQINMLLSAQDIHSS